MPTCEIINLQSNQIESVSETFTLENDSLFTNDLNIHDS